jgi:hypothetical protein
LPERFLRDDGEENHRATHPVRFRAGVVTVRRICGGAVEGIREGRFTLSEAYSAG